MKFVVFFSFLVVVACNSSSSLENEAEKSSFYQWVSGLPSANFEVEFSWDSLMVHRASEQPIECTLTVVTADKRHRIPAKISTRGVHRKAACDFPPLKLIIDKDYLKEKNWSSPRKYKLVTACQGQKTDHLYREYLAYKLQQLHLDYYLQSDLIPTKLHTGQRDIEGHVIMLEHEKEMARRLDFEFQDPQEKPIKIINEAEYEKLVLFQYLIGNTDWNLTRGHNIMWLVKSDQSISPIPVAYDFDQCGLVNAPYAAPYPSLPITSVRERFLQYRGKDKSKLEAPWSDIVSKQEETLRLLDDSDHITEESKMELKGFLELAYRQGI